MFVWGHAGGVPKVGGRHRLTESPESIALSKALKTRGFKFVGPVIVYAWMQAIGMVDDHEAGCFRRAASHRRTASKRRAATKTAR
jgi:DNA-3-methyladenine glycosylase I